MAIDGRPPETARLSDAYLLVTDACMAILTDAYDGR